MRATMQLGSASHILNKPRTSVAPHAAHQHPDRRANTPSPVGRRELLALTAASVILAAPPSRAEDDVVVAESAPAAASTCLQGGTCTGFKVLRDPTLAYEFVYPVATQSGRTLPVVVSRAPERYSSAAPLSADARQRIVCQLADLKDSVTISVAVGPPSGVLKGVSPTDWKPKDVANTVLVDKSTARVTSGQRISLSSIESVVAQQREGQMYYVYEHVSQGSPRPGNLSYETFRHAYSVSAVREGEGGTPFIYTLSLACPQELWSDLEGPFLTAVNSFTLTAPSGEYVAPDKDPWRFF